MLEQKIADSPDDKTQALQRALEQLEFAVAASKGGLWDLWFDTSEPGSFVPERVRFSRTFKSFLGYEDHEFPDSVEAWQERMEPGDRARAEQSAIEHLEGRSDQFYAEYRIRHRDESFRWIKSLGKVLRDESGRPERLTGIAWDITQEKEARIRARDSEARFRHMADGLPSLVTFIGHDERYQFNNKRHAEFHGVSRESLLGRSVQEVIGDEMYAALKPSIDRALAGEPVSFEREVDSPTMGRRDMMVDLVPHQIDGETTGFFALSYDITARKRLDGAIKEVAENERRRIGRELHDGLGQHLTGIAFRVKMLEETLASQGKAESEDAARISSLLTEAIQQTRAIASGLHLAGLKEQGLEQTLTKLCRDVEMLRGISCSFHSEGTQNLDSDIAGHVFRIARETIDDAIRSRKADQIQVGLEIADGTVHLTVTDNGSDLARGGHGVGLDTMRSRLEILHGTYHADRSEDGQMRMICMIPIPDPGRKVFVYADKEKD